ncbi:hypothetical protein K432DRAFT_421365 [Lepidopterella palustris CBS 459.81]|uniref:Sas10 C-terminal domain-containing protein n=1 Tax=Lepidopterella palustris CBS 459.81 TaxID=1314670 RepID=A0A8E2JKM4_9PEZI|nr:hypothetical protein K432DRAFT_421365 [Lepidopterella palustris CBS 459.81]
MAKKRKAGGKPYGQSKGADVKEESSKLNIRSYEDIADSEDEFHINRDKVLLEEGPEAKRQRKWREQDEFLEPSDEEVLAYNSPSEDDEEIDEEHDEAIEEDSSDDPGFGRKREDEDEDEEFDDWGPSKKDYYNADAIETEQDALDEEAEARRIQQKHLQSMTEADFGFDETEWLRQDVENEVNGSDEAGDVVTEVLPQLQITDQTGVEERLRLLKTRYPEFDHLAKDFLDLQPLHNELLLAASAAEKVLQLRTENDKSYDSSKVVRTPMVVVKYQALAAYLAAIAMYFALQTSTSDSKGTTVIGKAPAELRDHPVMESILQCRQLWSKVKDLRIADPIVDVVNASDLDVIREESGAVDKTLWGITANKEASGEQRARKQKKTKAQRAAEAAQAEAEARRAEKIRKTEEELAALASLTNKAARQKIAKPKQIVKSAGRTNAEDSDLGEETELTSHELAEKAKRKKSLRFYTSQIVQKANKRGAAGREGGGDVDIPHRERLRDRQVRLQAEAEKRGKKKAGPGDDLGGESDEEDRKEAREIRGDDGSKDDEYYDLVSARSKKRKLEKEALVQNHAEAAREGGRVVETEQAGADGKRKITYLIEKNKGLTPHRKRLSRNPRVKKKVKYQDKLKKLRSQKAVYGGGEQRGGYGGEKTGIKAGLVKSVKL